MIDSTHTAIGGLYFSIVMIRINIAMSKKRIVVILISD